MPTVYKSSRGRLAVRRWCSDALARAGFPLTNAAVDISAGRVALVSAGRGGPQVVVVPGTGFNAAAALPWLRALSARWVTTVVDLPGQPGRMQRRPGDEETKQDRRDQDGGLVRDGREPEMDLDRAPEIFQEAQDEGRGAA